MKNHSTFATLRIIGAMAFGILVILIITSVAFTVLDRGPSYEELPFLTWMMTTGCLYQLFLVLYIVWLRHNNKNLGHENWVLGHIMAPILLSISLVITSDALVSHGIRLLFLVLPPITFGHLAYLRFMARKQMTRGDES